MFVKLSGRCVSRLRSAATLFMGFTTDARGSDSMLNNM